MASASKTIPAIHCVKKNSDWDIRRAKICFAYDVDLFFPYLHCALTPGNFGSGSVLCPATPQWSPPYTRLDFRGCIVDQCNYFFPQLFCGIIRNMGWQATRLGVVALLAAVVLGHPE
jgi:hypothetical protein